MIDAFFVREGDVLRATELTRGPWNDLHQHGGPPSALLTRAIARAEPDAAGFRVGRVTVEYLRPIPIAAFEVRTTAVRLGRQVQRIDAGLFADGVEVAHAEGLRLRRVSLDSPSPAKATRLPPPESVGPLSFPFFRTDRGYHTAMEVKIVEGRWGEVPIGVWGRPRVPLVAGEETQAIERAMILADAESGAGPPLDPMAFTFVNPDLTVYFGREPAGEWIGMRVVSEANVDGIGLAQSELFDEHGSFGRAAQSLLIRPRAG